MHTPQTPFEGDPAPRPAAVVVPPPPPPTAAAEPRRRVPLRLFVMVPAVAAGAFAGLGKLPGGPAGPLLFFVGVLLGANVAMLATRALARPAGMAPVWASVGTGKWLGSAVRGERLLAFRVLPLIVLSTCLVVTDRPGLRRSLWWTTALVVVAEAAVAAVLVAAGGAAFPLGLGVASWTVLVTVLKPNDPTSRPWILFRLPFGDRERQLAEWVHDPATLAAARAVGTARVDALRAAVNGTGSPSGPRRQAMRAHLALAEGRYDDAAREALALHQHAQARQLRAGAQVLYALALADGVEAGHWTPADALPHFRTVLAVLRAEQPALLRATDLAALDALFQGRPQQAVKLASVAVRMAPEATSRTRALTTLAAARFASGRPAEARAALTQAVALSPASRRPSVVATRILGLQPAPTPRVL